MKNRKQTSPRIATLAAKTVADAHASKNARTLAASALAQSAKAKAKHGRPTRKPHAA